MNTCSRTLLIITILTASLQQQTHATSTALSMLTGAASTLYSYLMSRPLRGGADGGTGIEGSGHEDTAALSALVETGDFGLLTTILKNMLKNKDCALHGHYLVWLETNWPTMPPLEYTLLRHTAHRAKKGDSLKPEEINQAFAATFYFLAHCHIDTLLCMKSIKHMNRFCSAKRDDDARRPCPWVARTSMDLEAYLSSMRDDFIAKYPGVLKRVQQKYAILMSNISHPSSGLCEERRYTTILQQAAAASKRALHSAAWALAVWRDDRYDYQAVETVRSVLGKWAPGNEPGGLIFDAFSNALHQKKTEATVAILKCIRAKTLERWNTELHASLMTYLNEAATHATQPINSWETFFNGPVLSAWFNREAYNILYADAVDDASASRRHSEGEDSVVVTLTDCEEEDAASQVSETHQPVSREASFGAASFVSDTAMTAVTHSLARVLVSSPVTVHEPTGSATSEAVQLDDERAVAKKVPAQHSMSSPKTKPASKPGAKPTKTRVGDESDEEAVELETAGDEAGDEETEWF